MASPTRTVYSGPPLSGPGILWVNSKITAPDKLSPELFKTWYEEVHIRDIIAAKKGGVLAAWRYQCANPERPAPYLALYSIPDMGVLQTDQFRAVPMGHEMLPEGGPILKFVNFDTRYYKKIQVFEKEGKTRPGRGVNINSAAIQPAEGMEEELDRWYREEHLEKVSNEPGWIRSTRFELIFQVGDKGTTNTEVTPNWLAIHEFEADGLPGDRPKALEPVSALTKKIVGNAIKVDAAKFTLIRGIGDESAPL
ncbi:uncharacterized protein BDZ99DRAFT_400490 [Mytilinidion resinicola]|uniref:Uncharacterized protein n=1 Tax=Mytilinidion resinicola TaxID=574789 RepID=A0A6A6Y331_9PEZI|nr:uncharacterized protein BDZ99DRAFT_400490 [Mytilinidion resinicola]KAF2803049.1 hypothetical protein BDZ99DRAFT_400490 [Mytilinidion resinicola]